MADTATDTTMADDTTETTAAGGGDTDTGGQTDGGDLLQVVLDRGELNCGVNETLPGFGFREATPDWRAVVDHPDVDVVYVTAPNMMHEEVASAAAGDHWNRHGVRHRLDQRQGEGALHVRRIESTGARHPQLFQGLVKTTHGQQGLAGSAHQLEIVPKQVARRLKGLEGGCRLVLAPGVVRVVLEQE